ncbi:MAG: Dyp-type peroxidase [Planctomycetes bacterium]|nr:Dyp-type peroxidase [Planctomycetota bacterium]
MSPTPQPGILAPVPLQARYLRLRLRPGADARAVLDDLASLELDESLVVGLGRELLGAAGREVEGLRAFPQVEGHGLATPSAPGALWCWLRGEDRGELLHARRRLVARWSRWLAVDDDTEGFRHREGRDLSGYVDGTENPEGDAALAAACDASGASFVAVQRWRHELEVMEAMSADERDLVVGRTADGDVELGDAPPSAHVKRTAQESFDPPAFVVRRSMPWSDARGEGLVFVAFGHDLTAFEALWRRMMGQEDGVTDALFRFTRPVDGACYWCPPVRGGRLVLDAAR